jgi:Tfp pilus assembly protein PilX
MNIMLKKLTTESKHWFKQGQVALIVLLLMVVILTIGLSLASRSITDIKISQDEKDALRAFSAAEAGIEQVLSTDLALTSYSVPVGIGLSANVTVTQVGNGMTQTIEPGATMHVNLVGSSDVNQLIIEWSAENDANDAALQATIYSFNGSAYTFRKCGYNNKNSISNGFLETGVHGDCTGSNSPRTITINNITSDDQIVILKSYYQNVDATINSNSGGILAAQQYNLTSTVSPTEGQKASQIEVTRSVAVLPPIFDYALFNGTGNLNMD